MLVKHSAKMPPETPIGIKSAFSKWRMLIYIRAIALEDSCARFLVEGDTVACCVIDILLLTRLQFYGHWSNEELFCPPNLPILFIYRENPPFSTTSNFQRAQYFSFNEILIITVLNTQLMIEI